MIENLDKSEWYKIDEALSSTNESMPENGRVLAIKHEGEVVACGGLQRVILVSPYWVKKEFRGQGKAEELALYVDNLMRGSGQRGIIITKNPHLERLAFEMKMKPIDGAVWRKDF